MKRPGSHAGPPAAGQGKQWPSPDRNLAEDGRLGLNVLIDVAELAERVADVVASRLEERLGSQATDWLDVTAAAAHLGCSPERVRKLIARRAIPFHQERPGSRIFLSRKEIDEWILRL